MKQVGFTHVVDETGNSRPTYQHWPKRTFDRMFAVDAESAAFSVLSFGDSDHAPILGKFEVH
jgi:hypothetical protein